MAPSRPRPTVGRSGLPRYLLIVGVAVAAAVVAFEITLLGIGASQFADSFADYPGAGYEIAFGFVRVLLVAIVLTWLLTESLIARARTARGRRLAPVVVVAVGALVLVAWMVASEHTQMPFACGYSGQCAEVPWPGPHAPFTIHQDEYDMTLPESQWPPTVVGRDVDYLLGPGLALLALVVGTWGARRTAHSVPTHAATSPLSSRFSLGLVGILVAGGMAGLVACSASLAADLPAGSFAVDLRVWGTLAAVAAGFAVSGRRRGDLVLVLALVLAQAWPLFRTWFSGESNATLLLAVLALVLPAIAAAWRPLARSLDRLVEPGGAPQAGGTSGAARVGADGEANDGEANGAGGTTP